MHLFNQISNRELISDIFLHLMLQLQLGIKFSRFYPLNVSLIYSSLVAKSVNSDSNNFVYSSTNQSILCNLIGLTSRCGSFDHVTSNLRPFRNSSVPVEHVLISLILLGCGPGPFLTCCTLPALIFTNNLSITKPMFHHTK